MNAAVSPSSIAWSGWIASTPSSGCTSSQFSTATGRTRAAPSSARAISSISDPPSHPVSLSSKAAARATRAEPATIASAVRERRDQPRRAARRPARGLPARDLLARKRSGGAACGPNIRVDRDRDPPRAAPGCALSCAIGRNITLSRTAISLTAIVALLDSIVNGPAQVRSHGTG